MAQTVKHLSTMRETQVRSLGWDPLEKEMTIHPVLLPGKSIALMRWTFVDKVMSLLFNMLSRLVITFLPRSKHF